MMGPYRSHPVSLIEPCFVVVILTIVFYNLTDHPVALSSLVLMALIIRRWSLTRYSFDEREIFVSKTTLFKTDKTIPYSKISSINVMRTISDRIFGTVTLLFNVNSGINATEPEVKLVLAREKAENLRLYVESMFHRGEEKEGDAAQEPQVFRSDIVDILLHGVLSLPSWNIFAGSLLFIYSVASFAVGGGTGILALFLFIITSVYPVVLQILKYYGFKVYRTGGTIHLEHGLIQTYNSFFEIERINAIRLNEPLLARLSGRSSIQAEVVGINAVSGDTTPTLSLMMSRKDSDRMLRILLPEFINDGEMSKQPSEARVPIFLKATVANVAIVAIVSILCVSIMYINDVSSFSSGVISIDVLVAIVIVAASATAISIYYGCFVSIRNKGVVFGDDRVTFVTGVVDRKSTTLFYENVQMIFARSGPVSRRYGLSRCQVAFLSSEGNTGRVESGLMGPWVAERIDGEVLDRIRNERRGGKTAVHQKCQS